MCIFFFFNDTATTEIYTLSLHDALPISGLCVGGGKPPGEVRVEVDRVRTDHPTPRLAVVHRGRGDRKSTRLNSSHANISYAVFCLKKKKKQQSNSVYNLHSHQSKNMYSC